MTESLPCVCTTLRKAARAVTRSYDDSLAQSGMTTTQFAVLRSLAREGDMVLSALADSLVMERTSLYRTLAPIERQGWIAIAPAEQGHAKLASLTPAGRAAMDRAASAWERVQADMVGVLGASGWAALEQQLRTLTSSAAKRVA